MPRIGHRTTPVDLKPTSTVVISPHLDDAVLSAWHALDTPEEPALVVTLFAGLPPRGALSVLDELKGAVDSHRWMQRRRAQDLAALSLPGARAVHLDHLDLQYRIEENDSYRQHIQSVPRSFVPLVAGRRDLCADASVLVPALEEFVRPHSVVYGPLAVGGHPDHITASAAALALLGRCRELRLYADVPYFLRHGLPGIAGGVANADADRLLESSLSALPSGVSIIGVVCDLGPERYERKMRALRCYSTESQLFETTGQDPRYTLDLLRFETFWTTAPVAWRSS